MNPKLSGLIVLLVVSTFGQHAKAVVYKFTNIADNTTEGPNGRFSDFVFPSVSGKRVAFLGQWTANDSGIFTSEGGELTTIVKSGDPGPTGFFWGFRDLSLSGENVAFVGGITDPREMSGVFVGNGGPLTTIAYKRDPAPSGIFWDFRDPKLSGDTVAFQATYGIGPLDDGVFTGFGGSLTTIAKQGDQFSGITLLSFFNPTISGHRVAFLATYSDVGIFTDDGGALSLIAEAREPVPAGGFAAVAIPTISGQNIAFFAAKDNGEAGIYLHDGSGLTTITKLGDSAPKGTLQGFYDAEVGGDSVAILAAYGEILFDPSDVGIFTGSGEALTSVIKTGDPLFGSTLTDFDASQRRNSRAFGFDSSGADSIAFVYRLADGRVGVALATPVPEPSAILLLVAGLTISYFAERMRQLR